MINQNFPSVNSGGQNTCLGGSTSLNCFKPGGCLYDYGSTNFTCAPCPTSAPTSTPTSTPTTSQTRGPTFAPPPPYLVPVNTNYVCEPEVQITLTRRGLTEHDAVVAPLGRGHEEEEAVTVQEEEEQEKESESELRLLARNWTPQSCYEACLPRMAPATSFVINLYVQGGQPVCSCCL
jgi:hypothetical protein